MSEVHIRDYLAVTKEQMKNGQVSTTSMCGRADPKMNQLHFGDPEAVVKRKMKYPCESCRGRWVSQEEATGNQARALHKFRKLVQKTNSMARFTRK